ncbi:MAG: hypothetical protein Q4A27_01720 [bacterium]|nr:hypothetical protein [bacterium]
MGIEILQFLAETENYAALQHEFVGVLHSARTQEDFEDLVRGLEILVNFEANYEDIFWSDHAKMVADYILEHTKFNGNFDPMIEFSLDFIKAAALLQSPSRSVNLEQELTELIPKLFRAKEFFESIGDIPLAIRTQACLCAANYRCEEIRNVPHEYSVWNFMQLKNSIAIALNKLESQAQAIMELNIEDTAKNFELGEGEVAEAIDGKLMEIDEDGLGLSRDLILAQVNLMVIARGVDLNLIAKNTAEEVSELPFSEENSDFLELSKAILDDDDAYLEAILSEIPIQFPFI